MNEKLDIGDIVASVDAVQHDFTVEAIGFKKGENSASLIQFMLEHW